MQTVAERDDNRILTLDPVDKSCDNVQIPFNPESHRLSADFRLTSFVDPRKKSLQLEREERQSLLNLFNETEVIFLYELN